MKALRIGKPAGLQSLRGAASEAPAPGPARARSGSGPSLNFRDRRVVDGVFPSPEKLLMWMGNEWNGSAHFGRTCQPRRLGGESHDRNAP